MKSVQCPKCGTELHYGVTVCTGCHAFIEWQKSDGNAHKRRVCNYGKPTIQFDTLTGKLQERPDRVKFKGYNKPRIMFNSFGEYSR